MSNNKENKTNRSLLDTQRGQSGSAYEQFQRNLNPQLETSRNTARELSDQIRRKYGDTEDNNNFMASGLKPGANGWFDTSGMGGNSAGGDFASAKGGYQKFADTGGRENYADAEGSYKNFINNGGIGDSEAQAIRNRTTDQIPAFYDAYKRSAQRRANVQGGYSPGFDAQQAEMGRQAGREGFNASRQVEGDIADKRQQGRMFGTTGMAGIGRDVSGNQLSGLGGLTNIGGLEQQNNQFNAGQNQQLQMALQELYSRGGMESARGLQSLYSSAPGDVGQNYQAWLQAQGNRDSAANSNLGTRANVKSDGSWTDYIGPALGVAGAAFTGGLSIPASMAISKALKSRGGGYGGPGAEQWDFGDR